jgi:DnaJ-class molecular chaperone
MPKCSECNDEGMVGTAICPKCNGYGGTKRAPLNKNTFQGQLEGPGVTLEQASLTIIDLSNCSKFSRIFTILTDA